MLRRAQAVEQRYAGVNEELMQLRGLLEQAPGFVAILSGDEHRFVMANAAYRKLMGERELIGRPVEEALPEIVEQGFLDTLDTVRATAEPYFGTRELIRLAGQVMPDLHASYLEFIFQPIVAADGTVRGIFIQGHDVTEEVAAEEHQRLLTNELNHRVKNTLAIVQGLAQQSFRAMGESVSLDVFGSRLSALASAHNLLTERHWESADFETVVRRSLEATLGTEEARVEYRGPSLTMPPQPSGRIDPARLPTRRLRLPNRGDRMSFAGKTVLILEDEPIISLGLEDMLPDEGAQVCATATVAHTLRVLETSRPDCAVLDVNLHGIKSYPVAHRLCELAVPFVFATGYGDAEHPQEFVACPTLAKPYSMDQIRASLVCGD